MQSYRMILMDVFAERRNINPSYSLRAYARSCGISPASLSQILSGKRPLTLKAARQIADRLAFSPKKTSEFLVAAASVKNDLSYNRSLVDEEKFRLIADWYHYAILSLSELKDHKANGRWIAKRLGISVQQANSALTRLKELGFIEVSRSKMRQCTEPLVTTNDVPSSALRSHHKQHLERAIHALEEIPVEWREFGSMTMTMDPEKLPMAKRLIRKFRQELSEVCESGDPKLVYHLCVQLFPTNQPDVFLSKERDS